MYIDGRWFKDEQQRTLILRGVNLGSNAKIPVRPNGATHLRENAFEHRDVSFVGRPFPLEEADEHFARLKSWGFTFLRFLITWEAIEHVGPGIYDQEYLDYVAQIVEKAGTYGFKLFIDPHQDVWSRFSGGDGAPGWTMEAVGLDMTKFGPTGAALLHAVHGDPFPRMIWPSNYSKLAAATMFTLFFGGQDFAPQTKIDGVNAQEYLQSHYINAIKQLALRLKGMKHVVGYDSLNEPGPGFIGRDDLNAHGGLVELGENPTPFQTMLLGAGYPQKVAVYGIGPTGFRPVGQKLVNPDRVRAWKDGYDCIWRQNGVWDLDASGNPRLLKPDHFSVVRGRKIDFTNDYMTPFVQRFAREIRAADVAPKAFIFFETEPNHFPKKLAEDSGNSAESGGGGGGASGSVNSASQDRGTLRGEGSGGPQQYMVHAPHWYDGVTCHLKRYIPFLGIDVHNMKVVIGRRRVQQSFITQMRRLRESSGKLPTLIGEFGIAYDINNKKAYKTGNYQAQVKAYDRNFRAVEANLLSYTLWNYNPDNTHARGDHWNGEDFSIYSVDDRHKAIAATQDTQNMKAGDLNAGGRALDAVIRPHAMCTAGEPLAMEWDYRKKVFKFTFRHDPQVTAPTEIFVPAWHFADGYEVEVSDGSYTMDTANQLLIYHHSGERPEHHIVIKARRKS